MLVGTIMESRDATFF
jgi:hypothetical protein